MQQPLTSYPKLSIKIYAILFVFLVVGVVMLIWPILSMRDMLGEINSQAKYITLDKGAYYLFGGGLFFLTIAIGTVLSFFFKDRVVTRFVKYFGISLAVSLMLVFVLPQAVHYFNELYKRTKSAGCFAGINIESQLIGAGVDVFSYRVNA